MSAETMTAGDVFEPIDFTVTPESHERHLSYLQASGTPVEQVERWRNTLLPFFEVWPLARVVSRARFGRVNEVVALGASTIIHRMAPEGARIVASASLSKIINRGGLAVARFRCRAEDDSGRLLTETSDDLLLLHDCDSAAIREAIQEASGHHDQALRDLHWEQNRPLHLTFRHDWDPTEWLNNIHVPSYARSVGYEDALVEGAGVMDVIFSTLLSPPSEWNLPISVECRFRLPLYVGLGVSLRSLQAGNEYSCILVTGEPVRQSVLLEAKILHKGG